MPERKADADADDALGLMAPGPNVRKGGDAFLVEFRGARFRFDREDLPEMDALLDVLTALRRDLSGGDGFVPSKPRPAPREGNAVEVEFIPEHLEILRDRVRVGREANLDAVVQRAVRHYLASLFTAPSGVRDEPPQWEGQARLPSADGGELKPAAATGSRRAIRGGGKPEGLRGVGTTQLALLRLAAKRGFVTRTDVGRLWGLSARRGGAASARARADGHLNALVARNLLRFDQQGADATWVLTETGRVALEEAENAT